MSTPARCESCGAPLADDSRYCLTCGQRVGETSPHLQGLLERVRGGSIQASAAPDLPPAPAPQARPSVWRLPSPMVSALLVAVFVGFGALLGSAGSSSDRLAASAGPVRVMLGANGASTAAKASTPPAASGEPPASEPEATPEGEEKEEPQTSAGSPAGEEKTHAKESGKAKTGGKKAAKPAKLTDIKHVFLIVLSDEPYAGDFGPESTDRYLSSTLEKKGELLLRYDAIAHEQLPNAIALISGQGPTAQTAADCQTYAALAPGGAGSDEQALGEGCVYPTSVKTLPEQLAAKHLSWRAYIQGMDEPGAASGACAHPTLGGEDTSSGAGEYATYRNPFVYFQGLVSGPSCASDDVGLSQLKADLKATPPSFSYIAPGRCHDGDPTPCATGAPAGAGDASGVLQEIVPEIMASKAYKHDGLIVITADEAPSSGEYADSSSCCGQPAYPNYTAPGRGKGGGAVGALLLSPLIKGASTNQEPYDHYSLLRSIEDVFGLSHLGYAGLSSVKSFSASLLNASSGG